MIITQNEKSKRFLKISLTIIAIIIAIFILCLFLLKYEVEGENIEKLPFKISSITVASTADGIRKDETEEYQWNLDILQMNDIYLKIEKNPNYLKTEIIKSIKIENITLTQKPTVGNTYITRILKNEKAINTYEEENLQQLEYRGDSSTNLENLTIANQGGTIGFRYLIKDIANYQSNDEEIVYNGKLLEKANISLDQIRSEIIFDFIIQLESDIQYKTQIKLTLPIGNILEEGTSLQEAIDREKIIFKRI